MLKLRFLFLGAVYSRLFQAASKAPQPGYHFIRFPLLRKKYPWIWAWLFFFFWNFKPSMRDCGQQKAPPAQLCAAPRLAGIPSWISTLPAGNFSSCSSDSQDSQGIMNPLVFPGLRSLEFHVQWRPGWGCSGTRCLEPFSHSSSSQEIGFQLRTSTFTTSGLH